MRTAGAAKSTNVKLQLTLLCAVLAAACADLESGKGASGDGGPDAAGEDAQVPVGGAGGAAGNTGPVLDASDDATRPVLDAGSDALVADARTDDAQTGCGEGFAVDGAECVDIDECFEGIDACHATAHCENSEGAYACTCPLGYSGGGTTGIACAPSVVAGSSYTCAVLANGRAACWGVNNYGQLGDTTEATRTAPVTVIGLEDVRMLSAFTNTTCALLADGSVSCWGNNYYGILGEDPATVASSSTAVPFDGIEGAVAIDVGAASACAILQDSTVRCWGNNRYGQLGDGTTSEDPVLTPVAVQGLRDVVQLAVGADSACAVIADGTVRCWGANMWGQLGTGTMDPSATPVVVEDIDDVAFLDAGLRHVCALHGNERVHCWGLNTLDRVLVYDLYNASSIALGAYNTCVAHTDASTVTCWLYPFDAREEEGAMSLTVDDVQSITMGGDSWHACAVVADGTVRCLGANGNGQLGNGSTDPPASGTTVQAIGIDLF